MVFDPVQIYRQEGRGHMKPYQPLPGTFAARVIEYLNTFPPGTEKSSAALAEDLDQPLSDIANMLHYARDQGVLVGRREGKQIIWSLGEGKPAEESDEFQIEIRVKGRWSAMDAKAAGVLRELLRATA